MTDKRRVRLSPPVIPLPGGILGLVYGCTRCGRLKELADEPCDCRPQACHGCGLKLRHNRVVYLCPRCKAQAAYGGMSLKRRRGECAEKIGDAFKRSQTRFDRRRVGRAVKKENSSPCPVSGDWVAHYLVEVDSPPRPAPLLLPSILTFETLNKRAPV